ncbi:MAG: hypothetical protein KA352_04485 [Flavobacteriales bacterium]|nr:hypothetical protein [Flavobacteriales bacterium]
MPAQILRPDQYDAWFNAAEQILLDCRASVENSKRIQHPQSHSERKFLEQGFTQHLLQQYWFTLVTQTAKFFVPSRDNYTSFDRLIETCRQLPLPPYYVDKLTKNLPDRDRWYGIHKWGTRIEMLNALQLMEDKMKDREIASIFQKLTQWRHHATAHTALQEPSASQPTFQDLDRLTMLADDLFSTIRAGFGYAHLDTLIKGIETHYLLRMWDMGQKFEKLSVHLSIKHHVDLQTFVDSLPEHPY